MAFYRNIFVFQMDVSQDIWVGLRNYTFFITAATFSLDLIYAA